MKSYIFILITLVINFFINFSEAFAGQVSNPNSENLEENDDKKEFVSTVKLQGNFKIESAAIIDVIKTKEGSAISSLQIRQDIKSIFSLGFFKDVKVDISKDGQNGKAVTYIVSEKPSIRSVRIVGNKHLDKADIQEILSVKLFSIINEAIIQEDVIKINDLYRQKGYFLVETTTEIVDINENEVDIIFHVKEEEKVLVKKIYFVGNNNIKSSDIARFLGVKEKGFFSFIGSAGTFNEATLENDAMIIQAYYSEKGYIQAQVEKPESYISADKKDIYIVHKITEGIRYKVGAIKFSGDLIFDEKELLPLVKLKANEYFTRSKLTDAIQSITDKYANAGYAFANIVPIPDINNDAKVVNFTFEIEKGAQIYLNEIKISGNNISWDKVIRREILINEGELYRGNVIKESKERLDRLGYFEEVAISTPKTKDENRLNMEVSVQEKPTGTFNISAGFSSLENFIFSANISKQNFMGLGYVMGAAASLSTKRQQYNLNFFDPYFLDTRWTFRGDLYNVDQNYMFSEYKRGLDFGLGHYIGKKDDSRFSLKYTLEKVGLRNLSQTWLSYKGGELLRGGVLSSIEASFSLDKRNNRMTPSSGFLLNISSEIAGNLPWPKDRILSFLGGDFSFHRHQVNFRFYIPLYKKIEDLLVLKSNTTFGAIWSTNGRSIPLLQRYRAGGINSVRGYNMLSLGPTLRITNNDEPSRKDQPLPIGGYQVFTSNLELEVSIIKAAGIRGVVFFDAGNAFDIFGYDRQSNDEYQTLISDSFPRLSTGFGIRWFSPMGPLRFEWGFPLTKREGDRNQVFEFTIGTFF